ncbi:hypothetical protein [Streptomyces sp. NRRL F-5123]|uniref:hypothetical protein n=1 Tax=Streptomyces sp. NRRL F-5123 TaxID=1463856 RepID=UPI0006949DE9|nr:hypothetical protein [Streptomyces sp. NRRL F-5123]
MTEEAPPGAEEARPPSPGTPAGATPAAAGTPRAPTKADPAAAGPATRPDAPHSGTDEARPPTPGTPAGATPANGENPRPATPPGEPDHHPRTTPPDETRTTPPGEPDHHPRADPPDETRTTPPGEPDDSDDGLDDAPWSEDEDDRTDEVMTWLRGKRRARRRAKGREMAVAAYTVVIALAGYGSSFVVSFLRGLDDGSAHGALARELRAAMPAAAAFGAVALGVLAARDALWRGPVVVPGPTAGWLLAQPVRRERVLRPWFWLTAGLAPLAGLLAGLGCAAVLDVTRLASLGGALLAVLPGAVCLPLLAVALGMAVERRPVWGRAVRRWTAPAVLVLAALAGQAALAAKGHRSPAVEQAELWSGPWGWAGQPVVHAVGGRAPGWPAAVALLAAATAAALLAAHRDAGRVPTARLRERAATAAAVSAVAWSLELRAAKLAIMAADGGGPAVRTLRFRPPRGRLGRHLLVPWRDLLTLLRTPGRLGKAAVWTAGGALAAGAGADLGGERRWVGLVLGLLAGYLAVGTLAEPARLETDDVRRAAWAPYRFRRLMLLHGVVPAVLGAALGLLAAVPYAAAGHPSALVLLPACAPALAAGALVSAARGPARTQLLFLGLATPAGDPGPLVYLAWYAAGPLLACGGLALALAGPPAQMVVVALALAAGLALLAGRAADRLFR